MIRHSLIALLLTSALAQAVLAQDVLLYRADETVDAREVARILGGKSARPGVAGAQGEAEAPIRTRSLRMVDQAPGTRGFRLLDAPARVEAPRAERIAHAGGANADRVSTAPVRQREEAGPSALALPVQFAFDSAEILPRARAQLDALAEGIKLLAPDQRVVIEGHTDAAGSQEYNLGLSQRRAMSVKLYLVSVHGIDSERLQALGIGELQPLGGRDPHAVENRRVQFHGA